MAGKTKAIKTYACGIPKNNSNYTPITSRWPKRMEYLQAMVIVFQKTLSAKTCARVITTLMWTHLSGVRVYVGKTVRVAVKTEKVRLALLNYPPSRWTTKVQKMLCVGMPPPKPGGNLVHPPQKIHLRILGAPNTQIPMARYAHTDTPQNQKKQKIPMYAVTIIIRNLTNKI